MLIHEAMARHAISNPEHLAFVCGGEQLSYGELSRQSQRLATTLRKLNVCAGDRVGIWMPRTIESAVAVYGILLAGAAFVPIDPASPAAVVAGILTDCQINVLLTCDAMQLMVGAVVRSEHSFSHYRWSK